MRSKLESLIKRKFEERSFQSNENDWQDALNLLHEAQALRPKTPLYKSQRVIISSVVVVLLSIGAALLYSFNPTSIEKQSAESSAISSQVPAITTKQTTANNINNKENNLPSTSRFDAQLNDDDNLAETNVNSIDVNAQNENTQSTNTPSINTPSINKTSIKTPNANTTDKSSAGTVQEQLISTQQTSESSNTNEKAATSMTDNLLEANNVVTRGSMYEILLINNRFLSIPTVNTTVAENVPPRSFTPFKKNSLFKFSFAGYTGFNYFSSNINASADSLKSYTARRTEEEKAVVSANASLELSVHYKNWNFSTGLGYNQLNKKTAYSNSFYKEVIETHTEIVQETRNVYSGSTGAFLGTTIVFVERTINDTIKKMLPADVAPVSGKINTAYLDIPLSVGYTFYKKHWAASMLMGGNVGILTSKSGTMLNSNQSGLTAVSELNIHNRFLFKGFIGLEVGYRIDPFYTISAKTSVSQTFNNVYNNTALLKESPISYSIQIGLRRYFN